MRSLIFKIVACCRCKCCRPLANSCEGSVVADEVIIDIECLIASSVSAWSKSRVSLWEAYAKLSAVALSSSLASSSVLPERRVFTARCLQQRQRYHSFSYLRTHCPCSSFWTSKSKRLCLVNQMSHGIVWWRVLNDGSCLMMIANKICILINICISGWFSKPPSVSCIQKLVYFNISKYSFVHARIQLESFLLLVCQR